METLWDVIIIGGGPAGLTAGIYTSRHGLHTLILESQHIGGHAQEAHWIENYPGFPNGIDGFRLIELFQEQAMKFGVEFRRETVIGVGDAGAFKMISTREGFYQAKAIVVATGMQRKQLSIPGEEEFIGRGVSYCGICDGPLFKGKTVAVVGSGHEAIDDIIRLAEVSSKVYALPGKNGYAEKLHLDEVERNPKVEVIAGKELAAIRGSDHVTEIALNGSDLSTLKVDGVFLILDTVSTNVIMGQAGISLDGTGCIVVDREQRTNIPGIFAAGDCSCSGQQVVTAAGDGGKAGLATLRYVKALK